MRKNRIATLEKVMKHKIRPNNGCVIINYEDNPMTDEEVQGLYDQGIEVIHVDYVTPGDVVDGVVVKEGWHI